MSKIQSESIDRMMQFAKNHRPQGGFSNMYLIQKFDDSGNQIDELYGMNLMTDYGMNRWFIDTNVEFPTTLYIGKGNIASFDWTTSSIIEQIPDVTTCSLDSSVETDYKYPMYFDPIFGTDETGLVTCMMKYHEWTLGEAVSSDGGPFRITEYGLGEGVDKLWTHSWVYNQLGKRTEVIKNIHESLRIVVFLCYSYYEEMITSGWETGVYTAITTMHCFMNRMREDKVYRYKRNNITKECTLGTASHSLFESNTITNSRVVSDFIIYQGSGAEAGYFDGLFYARDGFNTIQPIKLNYTENVVLNQLYSRSPVSYKGYSDTFGHTDYPYYFTQIDVQSVNLFNAAETGDDKWTNTVTYHNTAGHDYDENSFLSSMAQPIYYSNNSEIMEAWLYQNLRTDDPIIRIESTSEMVYATNKYWDRSSWVRILNFDNVPLSVRNARYWITSSSTRTVNPVRESDTFYLIPNGLASHGYVNFNDFPEVYGITSTCDNYEYGWYKWREYLYYVGTGGIKARFSVGGSSCESFTYGKYLVTTDSGQTQFLLTDATTLSATGVESNRVSPLFNTAVDLYNNCYRTQSETGVICLQSTSASEANIITLFNGNFAQKLLPSKLATCIWGTKYVAYIPSTDTSKIKIYNAETDTDIATEFDLPTGSAAVKFMIGHTNFVWITDSSKYCYVLDLRDGSVNASLNVFPYTSNLQYIKITAIDDALITFDYTKYYKNDISDTSICIFIKDPTNPFKMTDFVYPDNDNLTSHHEYSLRCVDTKTLANNKPGKSIVLISSRGYQTSSNPAGSDNYVFDFGQYLNDKTVKHGGRFRSNAYAQFFFYGENIIYRSNRCVPAINFLPLKLTGTTRTVTTQNNIKNVSGVQYHITFGNIPVFGKGSNDGKVPGTSG